jgi:hypothetical protein
MIGYSMASIIPRDGIPRLASIGHIFWRGTNKEKQ